MAKDVVGLSLSFCVSEICRGNMAMDDVTKIVAGTAIPDVGAIIQNYKDAYWRDYPEKAEQVVRQLWEEGRIEQPRLSGMEGYPSHGHNIADGNWLDTKAGKQFKLVDGQREYSD